jgi:hypothetical protein
VVEYRQGRSSNGEIAHPRNGNIGRRVRRVARKEFGMNRLLMVAALGALLVGSTGCLHHNLRKSTAGDCTSCANGNCGTGNCATGKCNSCQSNPNAYGVVGACVGGGCSGQCNAQCGGACATTLGRMGGISGVCGEQGCRPGCIPGRLGWQQGGLDYSAHLQPGCMGHHAGDALNSRPFQPGPASAQVGYPYYSHRGPRDFLLDNPPTIGR